MSELSLGMVLLGTIAACTVIMTAYLVTLARRLNRILPEAEKALRESHSALRQVRRLLARGDHATRQIESVVTRGCEVAAEALERFSQVRAAATHFLTSRTRNGTRAGPRPNHRRRL